MFRREDERWGEPPRGFEGQGAWGQPRGPAWGQGQQQQHRGAEYVQLLNDSNDQAVDIKDETVKNNQHMLVYTKKTPPGANQLWTLERVDGNRFYIASAMDRQYVLDVKDAKAKSGEAVILFERKHPVAPNQLWEWQGNVIHSGLGHDLVLASHGSGHSASLIVETRNGKPTQSWREHPVPFMHSENRYQ